MKLPKKNCVICSLEFEPRSKKVICCSRKCGRVLGGRNTDMKAFGAAISAGKKGKTHRGVPHSTKTKQRLSEWASEYYANPNNNPAFGKKRSKESREKQSQTRSARILAGAYAGWFKKGSIETNKGGTINYRSSWEEQFARRLDNDSQVLEFHSEPFAIPYYLNNHRRHYHPDFLVTYQDGRIEMLEIKPSCFLNAAINRAKFAAGRDFCSDRGWTFRVLTEKELV